VDYFQKYSGQYSFDYLMIMAQGYQESFTGPAEKKSGRGGRYHAGHPEVCAPPINVPDVNKADKNILAGVRMLNNIVTNYFDDPAIDQVNRTLFTFASYNAGRTGLHVYASKRRKRVWTLTNGLAMWNWR